MLQGSGLGSRGRRRGSKGGPSPAPESAGGESLEERACVSMSATEELMSRLRAAAASKGERWLREQLQVVGEGAPDASTTGRESTQARQTRPLDRFSPNTQSAFLWQQQGLLGGIPSRNRPLGGPPGTTGAHIRPTTRRETEVVGPGEGTAGVGPRWETRTEAAARLFHSAAGGPPMSDGWGR